MTNQEREDGEKVEETAQRILQMTLSRRHLLRYFAAGTLTGSAGFLLGRNFSSDLPDPSNISELELDRLNKEHALKIQLEQHERIIQALSSRFILPNLRNKYKIEVLPISDLGIKKASQSIEYPWRAPQIGTVDRLGGSDKYLKLHFLDRYPNGNLESVSMFIGPAYNTNNPIGESIDEVQDLITIRSRRGITHPEGILPEDKSLAFAKRVLDIPANIELRKSSDDMTDFPYKTFYTGQGLAPDNLQISVVVGNSGAGITVENPSRLIYVV